jgi:hypothetical protein
VWLGGLELGGVGQSWKGGDGNGAHGEEAMIKREE